MNRRLYRSSRERVISGVAGGVAEYFDLDPSIVRVAWALLALVTGGIFFLLYIVMWIVVPVGAAPPSTDGAASGDAEGGAATTPPRGPGSAGLVLGLIFVGVGLYFLAREYIPGFDFDRLWPLVLVALGILLLVAATRQRPA